MLVVARGRRGRKGGRCRRVTGRTGGGERFVMNHFQRVFHKGDIFIRSPGD